MEFYCIRVQARTFVPIFFVVCTYLCIFVGLCMLLLCVHVCLLVCIFVGVCMFVFDVLCIYFPGVAKLNFVLLPSVNFLHDRIFQLD